MGDVTVPEINRRSLLYRKNWPLSGQWRCLTLPTRSVARAGGDAPNAGQQLDLASPAAAAIVACAL